MEPKYFTEHVRCYSDGRVERKNPRFKIPKWKLVKTKVRPDGYFVLEISNKTYYIHRIIASCFLGLDIKNLDEHVDHRNGVRSNNCVDNLRLVTQQENCWNTHAKGYYRVNKQSTKWQAKIWVNMKSIYLGIFDTEEEAREAYLAAKLIYHVIPEHPLPHQ